MDSGSWSRADRLALAACVLLALALRAPELDRVPGPLHPDEAADAVHARDLLARPALTFPHEGGGWDEGTYVWLAAPCVALADATGWPPVEAAVRVPALAAGLALVVAIFLLARDAGGSRLALFAALTVAVLPWAVHLSRLALRAALVPPLLVLGLWLLDRGGRRALGGSLLLALAAATYTPARLVVPLIAALYVATLEPRPTPRRAALLLAAPALTLLALLPWTLGAEGGQRLAQVGIGLEPLAALRGWALHFSPRFLFSGATSRGFAPEGVGLLPLLLVPLLVAGLARLVARAGRRDAGALRLLGWLALAPLAAAFTRDVPSALRAVMALPALALLAAHGADALVDLDAPARRRLTAVALALLITLGAARPLWTYVLVHPGREAGFYYAGRRELVRSLAAHARAGEAVRVQGPYVAAYARLYAPDVALREEGGALVLGPGAPRWEVVLSPDGREAALRRLR